MIHALRLFNCSQASPIDVGVGAAFFAVGFAPITALALSIIGWIPLHISAPLFVLPMACAGAVLAMWHSGYGRLAGQGLLVGMLAVLIYDCTRVPFIMVGMWGDFIPNIAMHLFDSPDPNWLVGYGWRYVGNGGGMGLAFVVGYNVFRPRVHPWGVGVGYGVAIWGCLLLTLSIAPHGEELLFALTPLTITLSLIGHVVYGSVLAMGVTAASRAGALECRIEPSVTEREEPLLQP